MTGTDVMPYSSTDDAAQHEVLQKTWAPRRGLFSWFFQIDHHSIGRRFLFTAFVWFGCGGILAALMRVQLAKPNNTFLSADRYNQIFTLHGITMMFLFGVPVMEALAVYVIPLMLGTRALAFPRANAYAYYLFLFAGLMVYGALFLDMAPDTGWFSYVPLASPAFAPGKRVDIWAELVNFTEISALIVAVEIVVTILKQRAPGMSIHRMPLYVWSMLVTALMIIFAMPSVMVASNFIGLDRLVGTHIFNPAEGGDVLLWQHLFWFFGHPEVYIIFIPGLGIVSSIVTVFCRRPVFGYTAMVLSLVATAFMGFGLWVHHMFATGLPQSGESFFTAASMMIAIPSGVQIFCWIATIWLGRPSYRPPFMFVLGFFAVFVIGGLSGVMVASVPLDIQLHDTFFVVAHLHYVLIGGAVFPLLGGIFYWFPKMTGRLMHEGLGHASFWLVFIGFNVTFFPMHKLGLSGMPRRVYTYLPETGWGALNLLATIGAGVLGLGMLLFFGNALWNMWRGRAAGADPWGGDTLEWATSSPPPHYNFLRLPVVSGREPLWHEPERAPVVAGLAADKREVLITHVFDAAPDHRYVYPSPSPWPFVAALATAAMLVGGLFTPWSFAIGLTVLAIFLTAWFWPSSPAKEGEESADSPKSGEAS
ncbi:MAG TPA: cytochrome c oxidase subunit I [Thermoanaerobaculia bacterium]|jgi:cytochrome c oxidase subunit 1|nr:cytochrome c oxidase subunit I [Thermoanaerobaculia bacterium]